MLNNKSLNPLFLGTCSWNYAEWKDIGIYAKILKRHSDYLPEYSKQFKSVEVDQWFWSLMVDDKIRLPKSSDVKAYNELTPDEFIFTIKAPNSLTLTHYYKSAKPNQYFLNANLFNEFIQSIEPLKAKLGPIMFEFEYLNKNKMASLDLFVEKFDEFADYFPKGYKFAIETRNPNYLKPKFFEFLNKRKIGFVMIDGYYMPPIENVYKEFKEYLLSSKYIVMRLLGKDRNAIEEKTIKIWNKIVEPRDETLEKVSRIIFQFILKNKPVYANINNHFEGSAPLTIRKLFQLIRSMD